MKKSKTPLIDKAFPKTKAAIDISREGDRIFIANVMQASGMSAFCLDDGTFIILDNGNVR